MAPTFMVHLRVLLLFPSLHHSVARRSIHIDGSHHDTQQQDHTLAKSVEVSAVAREALTPGGFGKGVFNSADQPAGALRKGSKQNGQRVDRLEPHVTAPWLRFGPRRANVALQGISGDRKGSRRSRKKAEETAKAAEAKRAAEAAEGARIAEAKNAEEAAKAAEAKRAAEAAQAARIAEAKKAKEAAEAAWRKRIAERAEVIRIADAKKAEEAAKVAEAKRAAEAAEATRIAEAKKAEEAAKAAEAKRAAEAAEAARIAKLREAFTPPPSEGFTWGGTY